MVGNQYNLDGRAARNFPLSGRACVLLWLFAVTREARERAVRPPSSAHALRVGGVLRAHSG